MTARHLPGGATPRGLQLKNWLDDAANRRRASLTALLAVNLIPLLGVFLWGWDATALLVLYWSENLILGAYNIVKMIACEPFRGLFPSLFFLVHYGGFCAVHGLFVLSIGDGSASMDSIMDGEERWPFVLVFVELLVGVVSHVLSQAPTEWLIGFAALAVSHGLSLVVNYFYGGEYREANVGRLMGAPYKRVVVLHVAILAGGWAAAVMDSPLPMLLVLVVLKTGLDAVLHLREHRDAPADG